MALSKEQKARLKQLKEERIARDHINALEEKIAEGYRPDKIGFFSSELTL